MGLVIWTNVRLPDGAMAELREGVQGHRLVMAGERTASSLTPVSPDAAMQECDVVFGQPDAELALASPRLRWIHVSAAGYTRYDGADFRTAWSGRGAVLTNSSAVYDEPCAEHALAFMLAEARRLPQCLDTQRTDRGWPMHERRAEARVLAGESVVMLGFGAIGRRLAELLGPFRMRVTAVRRRPVGEESVPVVTEDRLAEVLGGADHVINLLPENGSTLGYVNAERFAAMKPGAVFYNVGRGSTVDQEALLKALESGRVGAAFLDVTDPEPLPPEHRLWAAPRCFITPHAAGGHRDEPYRLVRHFVENLRRFEAGEGLVDRVI